jgi:hypothetical protein
MAKRNSRIQRIVINARVHTNKDRVRLGFALPTQAVKALGINRKGPITVLIRTEDGRPIYLGQREMTSGYEVYGTDMNITPGQPIIVEISDPNF